MRIPLGAKIIVTPNPVKEKMIGLIVVPQNANEFFKGGKVKAVGASASNVLKPGDEVFYPRNAGKVLEEGSPELIMTEEDIWWIERPGK